MNKRCSELDCGAMRWKSRLGVGALLTLALTHGVAWADPAEDRARATVQAWSQALDQHDLAALEKLYADPIKLYGKRLSKVAAIAAKRSAFKSVPDYHQSLVGDITLTAAETGYLAAFTKRSGGATQHDVQARLLVKDGLVLEESDAPRDRVATKAAVVESCEEVASRIVHALPPVQQVLADAEKAIERAHDGSAIGGIGPDQEDGGGFSVRLGVNGPGRFEALVDYAVDSQGVLSVEVNAEEVALPNAALTAVAQACVKH